MHAVQEKDGALQWLPTKVPAPQAGEVLIKVAATAVNRADLVQRSGKYPPPPGASPILGLECSGWVEELGEGVTEFNVGDQVCALLAGGGYASQVVVPAGQVLPLPKGFSLNQGAAIVEVFTTAWLNLRREGELKDGERVLIHAGASGVGTAAIQLCKSWGNPVVVTVGGPEKVERTLKLGASQAIDRHEGPWLKAATSQGKFDLILDPVGGHYLEANVRALNSQGRLVNIGLMGGRVGNLPLAHLLTKRLQIKGSVLRSRSVEEKTDILKGLRDEVWPLLESGEVKPIVHTTLPVEQAEEAHQLIASNKTVGKVILEISQ